MGLAVLPARLQSEIQTMREFILSGKDFDSDENISKHKTWFESFKNKYKFTPENTEEILKREIGRTFERVLEDAGVFKRTESGINAFLKFIATIR
jgi:UDPglucose--hexose-1-phosphate uridylyltransferase